MAEQNLPGEYENPYKFNAKELDSETDLYYYGARYYNPRLSVWYGVDPLAIWNPVMETEFYGDGQHNGGVYFWGNLNPYIYTYQNPIKYIDPNGKQTVSGWIETRLRSNKEVNYGTFSNYSTPVFVPGRLKEGSSPFVINCWHASERQIQNAGKFESGKPSERINMVQSPRQPKDSQSDVNVVEGVSLILKNLEKGKPVMAGVSYRDDQKINENVATDHFITIVGAGTDNKGAYFSYIDNAATGGSESGQDTQQNRLHYDPKSNKFIDSTPALDHAKKYILSEVRPTNTKKNN